MLIHNKMRRIRGAIYNSRDMVSPNAIIEIHGVGNARSSKIVDYDKIVGYIEQYNKSKNLHFIVNSSISKADTINIRINNL